MPIFDALDKGFGTVMDREKYIEATFVLFVDREDEVEVEEEEGIK